MADFAIDSEKALDVVKEGVKYYVKQEIDIDFKLTELRSLVTKYQELVDATNAEILKYESFKV